jgi:hypothetical protein
MNNKTKQNSKKASAPADKSARKGKMQTLNSRDLNGPGRLKRVGILAALILSGCAGLTPADYKAIDEDHARMAAAAEAKRQTMSQAELDAEAVELAGKVAFGRAWNRLEAADQAERQTRALERLAEPGVTTVYPIGGGAYNVQRW